jgi:hypothetical protein
MERRTPPDTEDELDDLLKFAWPELSDDLIDAPLVVAPERPDTVRVFRELQ